MGQKGGGRSAENQIYFTTQSLLADSEHENSDPNGCALFIAGAFTNDDYRLFANRQSRQAIQNK